MLLLNQYLKTKEIDKIWQIIDQYLFLLPSQKLSKNIYKRLTDHLTLHSIIVNEQHGFKPGSSTQQATFLLVNNISTAMNNK